MSDRPATVRRFWIPVAAVLLTTATVIALWNWPNEDFLSNDQRSMGSWLAVIVGILVLGFWLLLLSGMRWIHRFATLFTVIVLVAGGTMAAVDRVEFQGNLIPVIHWRWQRHSRGPRETTVQVAMPTATATDFPEYRNRNRDGVITGLTIKPGWALDPPKKLWQLSVGGGYGGISVVGPSAITLEQIGRDESVVCYDADTGKERWIHTYPALFRETMGGDGPRTNPTIVDGDVYSLGATGHLTRLDGTNGKPKWAVNILGDRNNLYWGMSGSPLVYDRLVVVNPGRNPAGLEQSAAPGTGPAVVAYDRDTGKVVWESGERQGGYSSPQLATIDGTRQVLVFGNEGLEGFDATTGKALWYHEWKPDQPINVAQPLAFDDGRVFISSGYSKGGAMLKITREGDKWNVAEVWSTNRLKCKFSSPVAHGGFIYGIDESRGKLACIDTKDGKLKWADGIYGNGQILLVGDHILVATETGKLVLVEATPENHTEVATLQVLDGPKNWNYLTVARGRAYVRNHEMMACYELPVEKK
jgi:outer membrane protein assembly factor BamB